MTRGIVYAATGEQYIAEAERSARSAKIHMPALPVALITNAPLGHESVFDEVVLRKELPNSVKSKIGMRYSPFEESFFVDTDTWIIDDASEVFELLERFDMAMPHPNSGFHYHIEGMARCFPEPTTGVILFKKNDRTERFFEEWDRLFDVHLPEMSRELDQRSFRHAIWESDLRFTFLTDEFNFTPYFVTLAMRDVKVLHGRPHEKLLDLERVVNRRDGLRVHVPRVGIIRRYSEMRVTEILGMSVRFLGLFLYEAAKRGARATGLLRR